MSSQRAHKVEPQTLKRAHWSRQTFYGELMQTMARIPAAQYLRMSTENQQYSLQNQAAAIGEYAACNNYEVIQSYVDAGKSELVLRHREG